MASIDPANKYYWTADTRRLDAEQIRDSILTVTGELDLDAGGPGVTASVARRSIYLRMMRNSSDPLLDVFDLPRFFVSVPARDTTTSPIQSLQLFNSQQMLRFAAQLSNRAYDDVAATPDEEKEDAALRRAWEIVFGRTVTKAELSMAKRVSQSPKQSCCPNRKRRSICRNRRLRRCLTAMGSRLFSMRRSRLRSTLQMTNG